MRREDEDGKREGDGYGKGETNKDGGGRVGREEGRG